MPLTPEEIWASYTPEEKELAIRGQLRPATPAEADQAVRNMTQEALEGDVLDETELSETDFAELNEFQDETLNLVFRGVTYSVPACDMATGVYCQRLMAVGANGAAGKKPTAKQRDYLDDTEEVDLFQVLLGGRQELENGDPDPRYDPDHDVWLQLKESGASWPLVQHFGTTAVYWAAIGRPFALDFFRSGGRPKAQAAPPRQPADRKTKKKATASGTQSPASGTSTTRTSRARRGTPG